MSRTMYVLPGRWDHAIRVANRFARRDGIRYEVRWFQPRRTWRVAPAPTDGAAR